MAIRSSVLFLFFNAARQVGVYDSLCDMRAHYYLEDSACMIAGAVILAFTQTCLN